MDSDSALSDTKLIKDYGTGAYHVPYPMITLEPVAKDLTFAHDSTGSIDVKITNKSDRNIVYRLSMIGLKKDQYQLSKTDGVLKNSASITVRVNKLGADEPSYNSLFRQDLLAMEVLECSSNAAESDFQDLPKIWMLLGPRGFEHRLPMVHAYRWGFPFRLDPPNERFVRALKNNRTDHVNTINKEYEDSHKRPILGDPSPYERSPNCLGRTTPTARQAVPFQGRTTGSQGGLWSRHSLDDDQYLSPGKRLVSVWRCYVERPAAGHDSRAFRKAVAKIFLDTQGVNWGANIPSPEGLSYIQRFENELLKTATVKHKHVVSMLGYSVYPWPCIIMPFYLHGNVLQYIQSIGNAATPALRHGLIRNLTEAVYYLHFRPKPIVHGDIKPDNVMVSEDDPDGEDSDCKDTCSEDPDSEDLNSKGGIFAVLIDLGLTYYEEEAAERFTTKGVLTLSAPEIFDTGHKSPKSDMWSFAATVIAIAVGKWVKAPVIGPLPSAAEYPEAKYPWLTADFWEVITPCWERSEEARSDIIKFRKEFRRLGRNDWIKA